MAARRRGAAPRRGGARRPRRWPKVLSTACQGEGAQRARRAAPLEPRLERRRSMQIFRSSVRVEDRRAGGRGKQRLLSAEADPAGWREGSGDVCGGTARENREETRLEGCSLPLCSLLSAVSLCLSLSVCLSLSLNVCPSFHGAGGRRDAHRGELHPRASDQQLPLPQPTERPPRLARPHGREALRTTLQRASRPR